MMIKSTKMAWSHFTKWHTYTERSVLLLSADLWLWEMRARHNMGLVFDFFLDSLTSSSHQNTWRMENSSVTSQQQQEHQSFLVSARTCVAKLRRNRLHVVGVTFDPKVCISFGAHCRQKSVDGTRRVSCRLIKKMLANNVPCHSEKGSALIIIAYWPTPYFMSLVICSLYAAKSCGDHWELPDFSTTVKTGRLLLGKLTLSSSRAVRSLCVYIVHKYVHRQKQTQYSLLCGW